VSEAEKQANLEKAKEDLYASGAPRGEPGEPLLVPVPDKDLRIDNKKRVFYRVVSGDTQYGVCRAFGVSAADVAAWNGLDPAAHLHPRMVLQMFVPEDFSAEAAGVALLDDSRLLVVTRGSDEHLDQVETRRGRKRVVYKAQARESFESIGKKVGLSARDLARVNRMPHTTVLEPGQEIIVYQVIDASRSSRAAAQARKQSRSQRKSKKQVSTRKRD
jgi:membrane-bound lytic murein transglycosylase D